MDPSLCEIGGSACLDFANFVNRLGKRLMKNLIFQTVVYKIFRLFELLMPSLTPS